MEVFLEISQKILWLVFDIEPIEIKKTVSGTLQKIGNFSGVQFGHADRCVPPSYANRIFRKNFNPALLG